MYGWLVLCPVQFCGGEPQRRLRQQRTRTTTTAPTTMAWSIGRTVDVHWGEQTADSSLRGRDRCGPARANVCCVPDRLTARERCHASPATGGESGHIITGAHHTRFSPPARRGAAAKGVYDRSDGGQRVGVDARCGGPKGPGLHHRTHGSSSECRFALARRIVHHAATTAGRGPLGTGRRRRPRGTLFFAASKGRVAIAHGTARVHLVVARRRTARTVGRGSRRHRQHHHPPVEISLASPLARQLYYWHGKEDTIGMLFRVPILRGPSCRVVKDY
jgi:hypothetical protein